MRSRFAVGLTALMLAVAAGAGAETRVVPVRAAQVIDNGAGAHRALLRFAPIEGLEDMAIARAELVLGTDGRATLSAPVVLQVHPILRDWTEGAVTWTAGWERAGGDIHDEIYARHTVEPGQLGREVRIDVESLVREMRYGTAFFGFAVTVAPYRGIGIRAADLAGFPGLATARLEVEYEAIPRVRLPERVR